MRWRLLLEQGLDVLAGGADEGGVAAAGVAVDGGGAAADLHSDAGIMLAATALKEDVVASQHKAVHAFHHHLHRHGARHGGHGGAGIIWLLILLHLAFIVYWGWIWWRQRKQKEPAAARKGSVPQKVSAVYDWTPVIPQVLPNIQLAKTAQH